MQINRLAVCISLNYRRNTLCTENPEHRKNWRFVKNIAWNKRACKHLRL